MVFILMVFNRGSLKLGWNWHVQSLLLSSPSADLINKEKECSHDFISLSNAEESFMKQKARINWLNLGDQNTGYFHNSLKLSTRRNSISCLLNEDGIEVEEPEAIKELAVNFYKRLLGRSSTSLNDFEMARISNLF